jgi:aspartate aminotransferase-like enzyme
MKGKVVRICHMGAITRKDLETGLKVLDESLKEKKSSSGSCCCCK